MSDEADKILQASNGRPEFLMAYLGPAGAVPSVNTWQKGIADFLNLEVKPNGFWKPIGPGPEQVDAEKNLMGEGPVAGEVTDIAIDPNSPAANPILFIATNNGGIWKSADGGQSWTAKMDFMPSLSMGAVAIDPGDSNVIYAGSGNLFDGGHAFQRSAGLYKSIDGGETWAIADGGFFGTVLTHGIYRIVCPAPDSVLVAATNGLFRSIDGGLNFGANSPDFDNGDPIQAGNISALILDTKSPSATAYFSDSGIVPTTGIGPAKGIFKLTINADKSVTITPGLFASAHLTNFNTIALAQAAPPNDQTMYASVQFQKPGTAPTPKPKPTYVGLFKTTNLGATWTEKTAAKSKGNDAGRDQSNYDLVVAVDPQDQNEVYLGFQQLWRSTDGGTTFPATPISAGKIHYDHHVLAFSPPAHFSGGAPTTFYVGEDGGIARGEKGSPTPANLKFTNLNAGVATSLFRGLDFGRGTAFNNFFSYGGMQDTGTAGHRPTDAGLDWHAGVNGDGGRVAVDPTNPQIVYGFDNEWFMKTTDAGKTWKLADTGALGIGLPHKEDDLRRIALEPKGLDPAKRIVYVSEADSLFKSVDGGIHFTKPALRVFGSGKDVLALTVDSQVPDRIWVGCVDGSVHFSADGGKKWDEPPFQTATGSTAPAADIAVDPSDGNRVAVVYFGQSGINPKNRTNHCYLTLDAGKSWNDVSGTDNLGPKGNLPDLPLRSVVFDRNTTPSTILVAADGGVLGSADLGKTWQVYGTGLPIAACQELALDQVTGLLRVATYGRSAFEFTRPAGGVLVVNANLAFDPAAIGQIRTLPVQVYNCGDADLVISDFSLVTPSADFSVVFPPPPNVTLKKGEQKTFTVRFQPTVAKNLTAEFQIKSNDPQSPAKLKASGQAFVAPGKARLAVKANLGFGEVDTGETRTLPVEVLNTGTKDLKVLKFERIAGSTDINVNSEILPMTVHPGEKALFTVEFKPSSVGPLSATFQIDTDASRSSAVVEAQGTGTSSSSKVLMVVLIVLAAAVVVGGGIAAYELAKKK